jgi:hypothetical protein
MLQGLSHLPPGRPWGPPSSHPLIQELPQLPPLLGMPCLPSVATAASSLSRSFILGGPASTTAGNAFPAFWAATGAAMFLSSHPCPRLAPTSPAIGGALRASLVATDAITSLSKIHVEGTHCPAYSLGCLRIFVVRSIQVYPSVRLLVD